MTREEILTTVKRAGFQMIRVDTFLQQDNVYIFSLPERSEESQSSNSNSHG